jgi:spoIIIJ-associated protein
VKDSKEFYASTVEEALSKASERLGIPEEDISYEVVDPGSDGFLGIGARDARITVSVETGENSETPETRIGNEGESASTAAETSVPEESNPELTENVSQTSHAFGDNDRSEQGDPEEEPKKAVAAPDQLIEEVRDYVTNVLNTMGLEARVDAYDTEEYIAVDIASDHTALIIGQKGETIDSLQHLVNSAIYRDQEFVKRIVLDSEGYRQRRIEAIQGMAHRTARKSVRERRDIKMPPMNSSERRVVHVYLKDNPEVNTFSEGSGSERRVTVSPN